MLWPHFHICKSLINRRDCLIQLKRSSDKTFSCVSYRQEYHRIMKNCLKRINCTLDYSCFLNTLMNCSNSLFLSVQIILLETLFQHLAHNQLLGEKYIAFIYPKSQEFKICTTCIALFPLKKGRKKTHSCRNLP